MNSADLKPSLIDLEGCDEPTGRKQSKDGQRERLSERDIYCVYWIRKTDHLDNTTEGYVGITKDLEERLRSHKKNLRRSHFTSAIKKYGWDNLVVEILHNNLFLDQALQIEKELRPQENIGWNSQRGGELGVNPEWYDIPENRKNHSRATSEATRIAIANKDTTEARAGRARQNWIKNRSSYEGRVKGSKNPNATLNEEQVEEIKYRLIPLGLSNFEIAKLFNVNPHVISFIRSGRTWKHV